MTDHEARPDERAESHPPPWGFMIAAGVATLALLVYFFFLKPS